MSLSQKKAEYQRKYRARKRAQKKADGAPDISQVEQSMLETDQTGLEIEVEAPAPAPVGTFRERMAARVKQVLGKKDNQQDGKKPARKGKKVEINFLTNFLPVFSGLLASYAEHFYEDNFKPCAPRQDEVVAVLGPIFAIVERRVQILGHMGEDALDLIAAGTALLGFIGRSYVTYADIKSGTKKDEHYGQTKTSSTVIESVGHSNEDGSIRETALMQHFGRGNAERTLHRDSDDLDGQSSTHNHELSAQSDVEVVGGVDTSDASGDKSRELAVVAKAFKRDAFYRSANGLL